MFGSHLSVAGSMTNALIEARKLGLDCVQVFTKNQQQWTAPPLKPEAVRDWSLALVEMGWAMPRGGGTSGAAESPDRVVSHASYLANMGSPDDALRTKSIALMREEVERCEKLGIPLLVFHPGAATGSTPEQAIAKIAAGVAQIVSETKGYRTTMCFEGVAGAGSTIGRTFEELAELRRQALEATGAPERVGFCLDTCHMHAAGYDLSSEAKSAAALQRALEILGKGTIRALHLNDSKGTAGSHLDRHEHIGQGTIGAAGFGPWVRHAELRNVPKIMETPKGETKVDGESVAWDSVNVGVLRGLAGATS